MSINKIYDACIIIRFLEEIKFKILFEEWYKNSAYNQCTTSEVLDEIEREARNELNDLISKNIIKVLNPVPDRELTRINLLNPNLSKADCSLFYYLEILPNCICLTDDFPLRLLCIEESIETHGTKGIYLKLKRDGTFPLDDLKNWFRIFKPNPRVFPIT